MKFALPCEGKLNSCVSKVIQILCVPESQVRERERERGRERERMACETKTEGIVRERLHRCLATIDSISALK